MKNITWITITILASNLLSGQDVTSYTSLSDSNIYQEKEDLESGFSFIAENSYLYPLGITGEVGYFDDKLYMLWDLGLAHSLTKNSALGVTYGIGFKLSGTFNSAIKIRYRKWLNKSSYLNFGVGKIINANSFKDYEKYERRQDTIYKIGKEGYVVDIGLNYQNYIEINLLYEWKHINKIIHFDENFRSKSKLEYGSIFGGVKLTSRLGLLTGAFATLVTFVAIFFIAFGLFP